MHTYSFSHLSKGNQLAKVFSTYRHHEQFPSYVVRVVILRKGKARFARDVGSFARIDKAEGAHAELVLRLAHDDGFKITSSSCM